MNVIDTAALPHSPVVGGDLSAFFMSSELGFDVERIGVVVDGCGCVIPAVGSKTVSPAPCGTRCF